MTPEAAIYEKCVEVMAKVCQTHAQILEKMADCDEFTQDQIDLARKTEQDAKDLLGKMIAKYLAGQ